MKLTVQHNINKSAGIQHKIRHHIKEENLGIIFGILRKNLYADNLASCLREVFCNSADAHTEAGKKNVPVKVTLPTQLDSFLKIRDYGFGLSDEKIKELYSGYGDSGKRHTNEQIGSWGLGKFSPLAITDSFIINSYQNGVVNSWNSYIDASNCGEISKMGSSPTTEPNGLEVIVPIKSEDIQSLHDKAANFFGYFPVTPELINATAQDLETLNSIKNKPALFSSDLYKFFGNGESKVVMGGVPYAVDANVFVDEISAEAKTILEGGVIIYANIGDLEVAASRETLNYSAATKKKLAGLLNEVAKDLIQQGNNSFKNCQTLWDAKCLYREVFDYYGKLYALRRFFGGKLTFNGQAIESNNFINPAAFVKDNSVRINAYNKGHSYNRSKRVKMSPSDTITAHQQNIVVENDLNLATGVMNRVVGLIETGNKAENVFVVTFKDDATKKQWLADTGFDGQVTLISSLPKEPLSKYYQSNSSANGGTKNSKHTTKEFVFNFAYSGGWSSNNSDYFTSADVDVDSDSGYYIIIDKFCYRASNGSFTNPSELKSLGDKLAGLGITLPTVYAFKIAKEYKVKANKKMISLWTYVQNELDTYFKNHPKKKEQIANLLLWKDLKNNYGSASVETLRDFFNKSNADENNDLMITLGHLNEVNKDNNDKIEEAHRLACRISLDVSKFTPSYDLKAELNGLKDKYPMLFHLSRHINSWDLNTATVQAMDDYIGLVSKV